MKKKLVTTVAYKTADGSKTKRLAPQAQCSNPELAKHLATSMYAKYSYVPDDIRKAIASMAEFTDGATARVAATVAIRNLIADLELIVPGPSVKKRSFRRMGGNSSKVIKEDLASMGVSLEASQEG